MGKGALVRGLVLLAGLIVPQFVLHGRSLIGSQILLPLDLLTLPGWYFPPSIAAEPPQNPILSDTIVQMEMSRRFAVAEVLPHGQIPLWNPYSYCGSPFLAADQPAVFSPYRLLDYAWDSPAIRRGRRCSKRCVAGIGTFCIYAVRITIVSSPPRLGHGAGRYADFSRSGRDFPWPTVTWLPWIVLAIEKAIRRPAPSPWSPSRSPRQRVC